MNVDRKSRDRLVDAIHGYLSERTTAFEFDEEIREIRGASDDPTVAHVASALWYHYDDCKDHTVVLSKEEWDYFHRLILLLKSNAHIEITKRKRWSFTQLGAAISLVLYGLCLLWLDIGYHLLAVGVVFGTISILLSYCRRRSIPQLSQHQRVLIPFSSASEMLTVRRSQGGFVKHKYPHHLKSKRIRTRFMDTVLAIQSHAVWLVFAPLVLFFQLFPVTETQTRVKVSP